MRTGKEQVVRRVFVDCPVCCSGNHFRAETLGGELECDDCGFVLADAPDVKSAESGRCLFCGGEYFYLESPLSVWLLGKDSICYICEATYKGVRLANAEEKYSPETFARAQESGAAKRWRARVERYNQGTG